MSLQPRRHDVVAQSLQVHSLVFQVGPQEIGSVLLAGIIVVDNACHYGRHHLLVSHRFDVVLDVRRHEGGAACTDDTRLVAHDDTLKDGEGTHRRALIQVGQHG